MSGHHEPPRSIEVGSLAEIGPILPVPHMDPGLLRGFERVSVPFFTWVNTTLPVKRFVQFLARALSAGLINFTYRNMCSVFGVEEVSNLRPPRGVLLVSNHRSFFDMYVTISWLYRNAAFLDRIHFPVRSNFFYTHPLGLIVNLCMSGGAMWPPVFRDGRKLQLNPIGVDQTAYILNIEGTLVGIHPEGTRGQGPDPYEVLPGRPGMGILVKQAHPDTVVLPYFITGLSNDIRVELWRGLFGREPLVPPVRIHFGAPMRAGDLAGGPEKDPQVVVDEVMAIIRALGQVDKARYADGP